MTTTTRPEIKLLPEFENVVINPMERIYKVDGVSYARVTSNLGIIAKPALIGWAGKTAALAAGEYLKDPKASRDIKTLSRLKTNSAAYNTAVDAMVTTIRKRPDKEKDASADRGHEVHAWVDQVLKAGMTEANALLKKVPPNQIHAVLGAVKYIQDYNIEVIATEQHVWDDELKVCGTFDLLGWMGDQLLLADWKSGKGLYWEMALQLGAYCEFHLKTRGILPQVAHLVQLAQGPDSPPYTVKTITDIWGAYDAYIVARDLTKVGKTIWFEEDVPEEPVEEDPGGAPEAIQE